MSLSAERRRLLLRADADASQGAGHAMRCLALGEAWCAAGGDAVLATRAPAPAVAGAYRRAGIAVHELESSGADGLAALSAEVRPEWAVVDGYRFGEQDYRAARAGGARLLAIEDHPGTAPAHADLILNTTGSADAAAYRDPDALDRTMLGLRYGLLRESFREYETWQRQVRDDAKRVLVSFGGAVSESAARVVFDALARVRTPGLVLDALSGVFPGQNDTLRVAGDRAGVALEISGGTDVAHRMAEADLALTAAGSSVFEIAYMQLPAVVFSVAPNQRPVARMFADAGSVLDHGDAASLDASSLAREVERLLSDPLARRQLAAAGRTAADGFGQRRVVMRMAGHPLWLRRATGDDSRWFWEWRNDVSTREHSFTQQEIAWADHERWFTHQLADRNTLMLVGVNAADEPIGQIRFDGVAEGGAVVNVSLAPSQRGAGHGSWLIALGCEWLFRTTRAASAIARVKTTNPASISAFERAGFTQREQRDGELEFSRERETRTAGMR
ncbi:MAG: GNAT family N-acetyltransferase [Acidobacteria bacterium]|nr:GNAT family N-acetyltransferase [Acidobacteriota bacterium]MCA1650874.1 GNAT family N-acetyltransferase [Acidobacteriota bacterium]